MTYHCLRIVWRSMKHPELVAILVDVEMAFAWVRRAPVGEYRRVVRGDFA
jgi:hypothetical protein